MLKINRYSGDRIDLCGPWRFAWSLNEVPGADCAAAAEQCGLVFHGCAVPGNFELDLHNIGLLPDPFFGMNPVAVREATERCHVYYTKRFPAGDAPGADAFLVFEGIDCFADVFVNGTRACSTDNMLIAHEACVTDLLSPGENEIFIHIRPALLEATRYEYPQLVSNSAVNYESAYVRKAGHMYGWDIMPRFLSAGMYRPAAIEYRPPERIEELYLKTVALDGDRGRALLQLHYKLRLKLDGRYTLRVAMRCGESAVEREEPVFFIAGKAVIDVEHPRLWHPRGRGEASLYDVRVELVKDGRAVDARAFSHGIRTVELRRTALAAAPGGGEFVFVVNGEKVFVKGTNWVPADAFHSRDRERIPRIMELVDGLNCNMVRCWGGNVYEDEVFYDLCDRLGILVWQDFGMACCVYPQDPEFAGRIALEAAAVVKRLRGHACVALWSGDNECDLAYQWANSHTDPNTNVLTRSVLPEAVRLHDGTRPYIGSSPFFAPGVKETEEELLPERHLWGPRDYFKSSFYTASLCSFVSEIGYHGCPAPKSLAKFISPGKLWPYENNEEWILHGTSPVPGFHAYDYRVGLMGRQVEELFAARPDSLEDFALASQAVQAEADKFFIELFRIAKWRRTGILWWNVMDGWPQFSDAVVDYYFEKKLAWHFIRNSQQDVCVMLGEPENWMQDVVVCNDTRQDMALSVAVRDAGTGETVFRCDCTAAADRSTVAGRIPYARNRQRFYVLEWRGDVAGRNHYLAGQPPFDLKTYLTWLKNSALFDEALREWQLTSG